MQHFADRLIGGNAAGANQRARAADLHAKQAQAAAQPIPDHIDHGLLKRGAEIGHVFVA